MEEKEPEKILWKAVYGMLPKNKVFSILAVNLQLREERIKRLRIYMGEDHPHAAQVKEIDWKIWHFRSSKEPRSDDALLSAPINDVPEDWGRVLLDWNNHEKDYKDPYNVDFNKLHNLYLQVWVIRVIQGQAHPGEKVKEDAMFKKLEQVKIDSEKALEEDPVKKAKAVAAFEKAKLNAIDIEKLVRKEQYFYIGYLFVKKTWQKKAEISRISRRKGRYN